MTEERKLSPKEKKLLGAVARIGQEALTPESLAAESGLSVQAVCEKLEDKSFRELFNSAVKGALAVESLEILHQFSEMGKKGSYQHGKLVLEIAGMHNDKQTIDFKGEMEVTDKIFKSEEERQKFLMSTFDKVGKPNNKLARKYREPEHLAEVQEEIRKGVRQDEAER